MRVDDVVGLMVVGRIRWQSRNAAMPTVGGVVQMGGWE